MEAHYSHCCGKVVTDRNDGKGTVCSRCDQPVTKQGHPKRKK